MHNLCDMNIIAKTHTLVWLGQSSGVHGIQASAQILLDCILIANAVHP